jgi:hypothetical protein
MKKVILSLAFVFGLATCTFSQDLPPDNPAPQQEQELSSMNKIDLSKKYIESVKKLNTLLPYFAFNVNNPGSKKEENIPMTNTNTGFIKKVDGSIAGSNNVIAENLPSIIPYADKQDIIAAIEFLQAIIDKIEKATPAASEGY